MHELTILAATRDYVDTLIDGQRHRVSRRTIAVADDYMDASGQAWFALQGIRLSWQQWQDMRRAVESATEVATTR